MIEEARTRNVLSTGPSLVLPTTSTVTMVFRYVGTGGAESPNPDVHPTRDRKKRLNLVMTPPV